MLLAACEERVVLLREAMRQQKQRASGSLPTMNKVDARPSSAPAPAHRSMHSVLIASASPYRARLEAAAAAAGRPSRPEELLTPDELALIQTFQRAVQPQWERMLHPSGCKVPYYRQYARTCDLLYSKSYIHLHRTYTYSRVRSIILACKCEIKFSIL